MIPNYSRVRLITDKYRDNGAFNGMIGYVIETYYDGKYEVEFSDSEGISLAQIVVDEEDLTIV